MKFIVDNNLSFRVSEYLNEIFKGSKHVSYIGLDKSTEDIEIWDFAKTNSYVILTKDYDFEALSRLYACPPKVIQLTCGNKSTKEIVLILSKNINVIKRFIKSKNCLMYLQ